jgi:hypothetical protein
MYPDLFTYIKETYVFHLMGMCLCGFGIFFIIFGIKIIWTKL